MKLLSIFLIALLFIQAFVVAKSANDEATHSLVQENAGEYVETFPDEPSMEERIKCRRVCTRTCVRYPKLKKVVCRTVCKCH